MIYVGDFEYINGGELGDSKIEEIRSKLQQKIEKYVESRGGVCGAFELIVQEQIEKGTASVGVKCQTDLLPENLKCINCGSKNLVSGSISGKPRFFPSKSEDGFFKIGRFNVYRCRECDYYTFQDSPELIAPGGMKHDCQCGKS